MERQLARMAGSREDFLRMGQIMACFQREGKEPEARVELKMVRINGRAREGSRSQEEGKGALHKRHGGTCMEQQLKSQTRP